MNEDFKRIIILKNNLLYFTCSTRPNKAKRIYLKWITNFKIWKLNWEDPLPIMKTKTWKGKISLIPLKNQTFYNQLKLQKIILNQSQYQMIWVHLK